MANSNVRFYKLATLPSFEAKHKGIFVHVTSNLTRTINEGNYTYTWGSLDKDAVRQIVIQIKEKPVLVPDWMDARRINTVESGLWFGGENGWELLSNDTTSGAIDAAIDAKIQELDVLGYAQAEINGSTLTIFGIKEVDGRIVKDEDNDKKLEVAIDGVYDKTNNKIATQSTVTTAIEALDVNTVQAVTFNTSADNGNTTLTFKGIKEVDGKIYQGDDANPSTLVVGDAKLKIQIGSNEAGAFEVFSANAKENKSIFLDGNVFKKNVVEGKNVLSIYTTEGVSSTNPLVTQNDINSLAGAMHYKGPLTGAQSGAGSWPLTVAAGDVYIVTTSFTHSDESNPFEVGDMIVFNSTSASDYKVVQSNITLGTGVGQVAANSAALTENNIVVATSNGIKTIGITETQLTGDDNNKRELSYRNGAPDTDTNNITLYHDVTISDAFTVIGKDFTKTINISSNNRSIEIAANGSTGVVVDLVWNTRIE